MWKPNPNTTVFGGAGFGRGLIMQVEASMMALMPYENGEERVSSSFSPPAMWEWIPPQGRMQRLSRTKSVGVWCWTFQPPELCGEKPPRSFLFQEISCIKCYSPFIPHIVTVLVVVVVVVVIGKGVGNKIRWSETRTREGPSQGPAL